MEITAGVADGVQSAILEQVTNGVAIRMAVMERALSQQSKEAAHDGARDLRTAGSSIRRRAWMPPKDILLKDGRVAEIAGPGQAEEARMARRCWTRRA